MTNINNINDITMEQIIAFGTEMTRLVDECERHMEAAESKLDAALAEKSPWPGCGEGGLWYEVACAMENVEELKKIYSSIRWGDALTWGHLDDLPIEDRPIEKFLAYSGLAHELEYVIGAYTAGINEKRSEYHRYGL